MRSLTIKYGVLKIIIFFGIFIPKIYKMITLEDAIRIIEEELKKINFPETPENLYDPIKYALSGGGKRIRPALTLLACNLFSENYKNAIFPALAIELFHNFSLIHDDLMDNSPLRRNEATLHIKWNPNTAILAGDALNILAYKLINQVERKILPEILEIFNDTAIKVCEGQMMDMDFESRNDVTVDEYLKMISLKTSVLLASALKIGAITGAADKENADTIYKFGYNLGLAFQLQDDLLDTFGDEKIFGKKIGNDIITNKKTYLFIKTLELASEKQKENLKYLYSSKTINNDQKIRKVMEIFHDLKIRSHTEKIIHDYHQDSLEYLDKLDINKERKNVLEHFAIHLLKRNN